uniref:Uncharacterized protein n=1 Tax=Glossina pallidipes TaxID=7398 RepID=A0A1A9ZGS3_GLOPL
MAGVPFVLYSISVRYEHMQMIRGGSKERADRLTFADMLSDTTLNNEDKILLVTFRWFLLNPLSFFIQCKFIEFMINDGFNAQQRKKQNKLRTDFLCRLRNMQKEIKLKLQIVEESVMVAGVEHTYSRSCTYKYEHSCDDDEMIKSGRKIVKYYC